MHLDAHQHFWRYSPAEHTWMNDRMAVLKREIGAGNGRLKRRETGPNAWHLTTVEHAVIGKDARSAGLKGHNKSAQGRAERRPGLETTA